MACFSVGSSLPIGGDLDYRIRSGDLQRYRLPQEGSALNPSAQDVAGWRSRGLRPDADRLGSARNRARRPGRGRHGGSGD